MLPREVSQAVFIRDNFQCRRCKWRGDLHPHHVIHKAQGGQDTLNNLVTLCAECHRMHHDGKLEVISVEVQPNNVKVAFKLKGKI